MNAPELPIHDIVESPLTSVWPLAWGWWLLIALTVALLTSAIWMLLRHHRRQAAKRSGLRYLQQPQQSLSTVNQLAKRLALAYFPTQQVAPLQGAGWHQFLIATYPPSGQQTFSQQLTPYTDMQYQPVTDEQVDAYRQLILDWAQRALPPKGATYV